MHVLPFALAAMLAMADGEAVMSAPSPPADPDNPTCPKALNWSTYREMRFTFEKSEDQKQRILLAEGRIDPDAATRLEAALKQYSPIDEIWIRSPGGDARVGNEAGMMIRKEGVPTRIPEGWACFSACNFMFMGGPIRYVEPGAQFVVHMFTHLADKDAVNAEVAQGADKAVRLMSDMEQDSAMLASEDNDFLIRMGVSRKLLTEVMYKQKAVAADDADKSTRRCLTPKEALKYNVANAQ